MPLLCNFLPIGKKLSLHNYVCYVKINLEIDRSSRHMRLLSTSKEGERGMYNVGEKILYDSEGICTITEIAEKTFAGMTSVFYVLTPINKKTTTIYVPVDNENRTSKMKKVLSEQEIYDLIDSMPDEETIWIEDDAKRKEVYQDIIHSGDRVKLIQLLKTLQIHKTRQEKSGKKLHISDEHFMKTAEKILHEELSHVLNIDPNEVALFLVHQLKVRPN